ncbi:DUF3461 family protein [Marinobacterium aestuariivivens]|uniref:DUF3461 family protein n=1 Tax=Marinobacterium aestuariivivens TaxID=1698799 RepID=A0ABW2A0W0_9GAMM
MSTFPTLTAMGIRHTEEISRFTLHEGSHSDELKVYFRQAPGGHQPQSMKFHFDRPCHDNRSAAPELLQALDELRQLTRNGQPAPTRHQLLTELNQLELVFSAKIEELRHNLQQWK